MRIPFLAATPTISTGDDESSLDTDLESTSTLASTRGGEDASQLFPATDSMLTPSPGTTTSATSPAGGGGGGSSSRTSRLAGSLSPTKRRRSGGGGGHRSSAGHGLSSSPRGIKSSATTSLLPPLSVEYADDDTVSLIGSVGADGSSSCSGFVTPVKPTNQTTGKPNSSNSQAVSVPENLSVPVPTNLTSLLGPSEYDNSVDYDTNDSGQGDGEEEKEVAEAWVGMGMGAAACSHDSAEEDGKYDDEDEEEEEQMDASAEEAEMDDDDGEQFYRKYEEFYRKFDEIDISSEDDDADADAANADEGDDAKSHLDDNATVKNVNEDNDKENVEDDCQGAIVGSAGTLTAAPDPSFDSPSKNKSTEPARAGAVIDPTSTDTTKDEDDNDDDTKVIDYSCRHCGAQNFKSHIMLSLHEVDCGDNKENVYDAFAKPGNDKSSNSNNKPKKGSKSRRSRSRSPIRNLTGKTGKRGDGRTRSRSPLRKAVVTFMADKAPLKNAASRSKNMKKMGRSSSWSGKRTTESDGASSRGTGGFSGSGIGSRGGCGIVDNISGLSVSNVSNHSGSVGGGGGGGGGGDDGAGSYVRLDDEEEETKTTPSSKSKHNAEAAASMPDLCFSPGSPSPASSDFCGSPTPVKQNTRRTAGTGTGINTDGTINKKAPANCRTRRPPSKTTALVPDNGGLSRRPTSLELMVELSVSRESAAEVVRRLGDGEADIRENVERAVTRYRRDMLDLDDEAYYGTWRLSGYRTVPL